MKMNTILWIAQAALAIRFLAVSYSHGIRPGQKKTERGFDGLGAWGRPVMVLSGLLCFLGAAGLVLPAATGIPPGITVLAAALLAVLALASMLFHSACRGKSSLVTGLVVFALCLFVAYGRWAIRPL